MNMRPIKEADWKILRRLHPVALERFCQRTVEQVSRMAADESKGFHQRYLDVFDFLQAEDRELALTFDELKRSNAFRLIAAMKHRMLLTEEEFAGFSEETREIVLLLLG